MQSGELIVIGKDKVIIPLHGFPSAVKCYFRHNMCVIPCNPQHSDSLEYEVLASHHHNHKGYVLSIKWSVSGVREIVWHVHY